MFAIAITALTILYLKAYPILMWIVIIICWSIYLIFGIIYSSVYFNRTCYYVSTNEVAKRSGIIYESKQLIKIKSIQYITTITTPLSEFTGFNFLKLNALGGNVFLLFLSKKDCEEIISLLSAIIKSNNNN